MDYLLLVSISCVALWTIMLIIALLRYWNKADEYRTKSTIYKNYLRLSEDRGKRLGDMVAKRDETILQLRRELEEKTSENKRQLEINAKLMERIKKGIVHE